MFSSGTLKDFFPFLSLLRFNGGLRSPPKKLLVSPFVLFFALQLVVVRCAGGGQQRNDAHCTQPHAFNVVVVVILVVAFAVPSMVFLPLSPYDD